MTSQTPFSERKEPVSLGVHRPRRDEQDYRLAVARADRCGRFHVTGKVDVSALHPIEPAGQDGVEVPPAGPVEQLCGRWRRLETEINRDRVALVRPDPAPVFVEQVPLLRIRGYYPAQVLLGERHAMRGRTREQRVDVGPSEGVELEVDSPGLVTEHEREELADSDIAFDHFRRSVSS